MYSRFSAKSIKTDILVINDWKSSEIITTPERVALVWYIGFLNFKLIFFHILWQFETIGFRTLKLVIWKCIIFEKNIIFKHPTHPQKEGPIQICHIEGVVSQISSLTFFELVGKNVKKRFKNLKIWNSAFDKAPSPMKQLGTGLPVSNLVVHYENYQWTPWPSNLYCKVVKRYL